MRENTALLHQRFQGDPSTGGTLTPIAQTSAFCCQSAEELEAVCAGKKPGYAYTRIGNPTINAFEVRMAALEGGVAAVACSSGMAAVSMALLNILESGDEIIAGAGLFGGTLDFFQDLKALGITTRTVEHLSQEEIEPLLNERTKVIFGELIGNPKLDVIDIPAVSALAHERGIPLFIDSTTATPILAHPLKLGADVVIHSTSKYINGSGSGISGVIIDGGRSPGTLTDIGCWHPSAGLGNWPLPCGCGRTCGGISAPVPRRPTFFSTVWDWRHWGCAWSGSVPTLWGWPAF